VATDASKGLVSVTNTGTGNNVLATSPTITTPTISSLSSAAATALTLQSAGTTAITVDTSQNVGIGTTAPQQRLGIKSASNVPQLYLIQNNVANDGWKMFGDSSAGYLSFLRTVSGSDTESMRLTSAGFLCINATSTGFNETLRINTAGQQGIHINDTTSSSSINYQYFTKGAGLTNVGAIYYNGSVMAYQTTSDYRLKENIAPMIGALAKIAALKPVTYTWKDNQRDGEGFIAHELQEHFPDAVSGIKDDVDEDGNPKYQGMDASILIATLTAAIQEQQALIDTQAATITALTARVTALENA
jgi:hypothetical protein